MYQDSKFLESVVCFTELVSTSLWAVRAEQLALYTEFLPGPPTKGITRMNVYSFQGDCESGLF